MTLAFGLACVPFSNAVYEKWTDISVDLPQVGSVTPIIVIPAYWYDMPCCFGSHAECDCRLIETNKTNSKKDK